MPTTAATYAYLALTDPTIKKWHLGAAELGSVCFCGTRLLEPQDTHAAAKRVPEADRHHESSPDLALVDCGLCKRNREYAYATGTPRPEGAALTVPKARFASGVDAATLTGATADPAAARAMRRAASQERAAARSRSRRREAPSQHAGGSQLTAEEAAQMAADAAAATPQHAPGRPRRASRASRADAATARDAARRGQGMPDGQAAALLVDGLSKRARASRAQTAAVTAGADEALAAIEAAVGAATGETAAEAAARPATADEQAIAAALNPPTSGERARARRGRRVATGNPRADRPMSKAAKARALVDEGLAATLAEARAQLADMGE